MDNLDDIDNLEPWEQQILLLHMMVLTQQAQIKVHESVLEQLLRPQLQGKNLLDVYSARMEQMIQRVLADVADTGPTRASQIARLLAVAKKKRDSNA